MGYLYYHAPDGRTFKIDTDKGWDKDKILAWAAKEYPDFYKSDQADQGPPSIADTFGSSLARGAGELGAYVGDILPGIAGKALGFEEFGKRNIAEGEQRLRDLASQYPNAIQSISNIGGVGDAARYVSGLLGSAAPSTAVGLGGAGAGACSDNPRKPG